MKNFSTSVAKVRAPMPAGHHPRTLIAAGLQLLTFGFVRGGPFQAGYELLIQIAVAGNPYHLPAGRTGRRMARFWALMGTACESQASFQKDLAKSCCRSLPFGRGRRHSSSHG